MFRIYDPDGHIVEVGESIPVFVARFLSQGMSIEEVAERTSVPEYAVREIAKTCATMNKKQDIYSEHTGTKPLEVLFIDNAGVFTLNIE